MVIDLRANYSHLAVDGSYLLDAFGGSTLPSFFSSPANGSFNFDLNGRNASLMSGNDVASTQRQFNLVSFDQHRFG